MLAVKTYLFSCKMEVSHFQDRSKNLDLSYNPKSRSVLQDSSRFRIDLEEKNTFSELHKTDLPICNNLEG